MRNKQHAKQDRVHTTNNNPAKSVTLRKRTDTSRVKKSRHDCAHAKDTGQGPVSRKSRELFGPEKLVVKRQSACFEKMIFLHVFNIRKIKRIAKFEGLEPRRCEDIKGIVAPERDPKSFGTFEKQAPGYLRFISGSTLLYTDYLSAQSKEE